MTRNRGRPGVLGIVLCCCGLLLPATASALQQPDYLRQHCPIAVTVVGAITSTSQVSGHKAGVSLQGVRTQAPVGGFPEPAVKYTWQLSKQDKFCGMVGTLGGTPVSRTSFTPTTATARSGSYIDWSVNAQNPLDGVVKFTVYAKPVAPRASHSSRPRAAAGHQAATAPPLHSVRYMDKNCPIVVAVNISTPGRSVGSKSGVSVRGQKVAEVTAGNASYPVVKYTWHLSHNDQFCGIVGGWYGPRYMSLRPTSQTAYGGEYTDLSQKEAASPTGSLQQFTVYARRKTG